MKAQKKRQLLRRQRRQLKKRRLSKASKISKTRSKSTAIIYRDKKPVVLNQTQIQLIRDLYARDATPQEFELFMQICRSSRLDPFKKEIYCLIFSKDKPEKRQMVIITGIDGYRSMAARDHKDYGGADAAVFTWFEPELKTPAQKRIPESATVTVKDTRGGRTTATVWWEELAPRDLKEQRADFWNRAPKNQLEKCAEAKGLRKRFPGRGNIFIREEMDQALQDLTPQGRQISTEGVAPSGAIVNPYEYAKAQQQQIFDEKLAHGHLPGSEKAKHAEAVLERIEAEDAKFRAAKNVTPKESAKPKATAETAVGGDTTKPKRKIPADAKIITGNMTRCVTGKTAKDNPTRSIFVGGIWYTSYRTTLFPFLDLYGHSGGGFRIEMFVDKSMSIIGLIRIGPQQFADDGVTPLAMEPKREPGMEG